MRAVALFACALALSGCGLRPVYSGGSSGSVQTLLASVQVAPIEGQSGWLVSNALRDRLSVGDASTPRYRLEVKLDDQIAGLGVRRDDSVARERRTLRARYQLIDLSSGAVMLDATAGSDAGIDVVGGLQEKESRALNRAWLFGLAHGRPLVTWKFAATLDGRSAAADGSRMKAELPLSDESSAAPLATAWANQGYCSTLTECWPPPPTMPKAPLAGKRCGE